MRQSQRKSKESHSEHTEIKLEKFKTPPGAQTYNVNDLVAIQRIQPESKFQTKFLDPYPYQVISHCQAMA